MDPMDSDPGPAGGPAPVPAAASAAQPAAASRPSPAAPQCVPSFPGHGCGPAAAAGEGPAVPDPDDEGDSEQPPRRSGPEWAEWPEWPPEPGRSGPVGPGDGAAGGAGDEGWGEAAEDGLVLRLLAEGLWRRDG